MTPISNEALESVFASSCECRPLDIRRTEHGHDCDFVTCIITELVATRDECTRLRESLALVERERDEARAQSEQRLGSFNRQRDNYENLISAVYGGRAPDFEFDPFKDAVKYYEAAHENYSLQAQRDAARAEAASMEGRVRELEQALTTMSATAAEVAAQRDAMRPVVEAAERWSDEHADADWHCCSPLVAAVDAYRAGTKERATDG